MENIKFSELIFTKPGVYNYTIKELTPSGYGWATDGRVYRITIKVTANEYGELVAIADFPDGKPQFTNIFSCIPTRITIRAVKLIYGICIKHQYKYDCRFLFGLYNEKSEQVSTANNFEEMVTFPKILFTSPGTYKYTIKELTQPFCPCWTIDDTVFPVEVIVAPNIDGRLEAQIFFTNGEPVFINKFDPCRYCKCDKSDKCIDCGQCDKHQRSIPTCY